MNHIHPVIRILSFLIFGLCVSFGSEPQLLLASLAIVLGYASVRFANLAESWMMLKRMRWLFLSIFIVYLWFTPGHRLFPFLQSVSPSVEGLALGFVRVYSLFLIVIGVNLFIRSIEREELIRAILWLLKPFRHIGLPYERLAIRIALTFDFVGEARTLFQGSGMRVRSDSQQESENCVDTSTSRYSRILKRLSKISDSAVQLFQNVLEKAASTECHHVSIPEYNTPPAYQWLYLLGFLSLCIILPKIFVL